MITRLLITSILFITSLVAQTTYPIEVTQGGIGGVPQIGNQATILDKITSNPTIVQEFQVVLGPGFYSEMEVYPDFVFINNLAPGNTYTPAAFDTVVEYELMGAAPINVPYSPAPIPAMAGNASVSWPVAANTLTNATSKISVVDSNWIIPFNLTTINVPSIQGVWFRVTTTPTSFATLDYGISSYISFTDPLNGPTLTTPTGYDINLCDLGSDIVVQTNNISADLVTLNFTAGNNPPVTHTDFLSMGNFVPGATPLPYFSQFLGVPTSCEVFNNVIGLYPLTSGFVSVSAPSLPYWSAGLLNYQRVRVNNSTSAIEGLGNARNINLCFEYQNFGVAYTWYAPPSFADPGVPIQMPIVTIR